MIKCGKNSREIIINIILLILYSILTLIVAIHHEPYTDEAQQWLIARDCTFFEMIFNVAKYEGTPMLWHSFLRVLNFFHFPYEELFIIPWILGSFACYLFLFKSKFPLILKILFPFTYFIFYQYAIIAKNHSLLFPLLFLIAVNYKNRRKKSLLYLLLLMLLASTSAYGFVIAFILLCFYTFDIIQLKERKYYIGIILSFLFMLFTVIYAKKAPDCYFLGLGGIDFSLLMLPYAFVDAFFGYRVLELLPQKLDPIPLTIVFLSLIISTITFYYSICKTLCKNQYQLIFFITINFLITVSIAILYYEAWHLGYISAVLVFSCWILLDENNIKSIPFKSNKLFYISFILIFSIQIFWSIRQSLYDIKNPYDGSKEAAKFIKENKLDKYPILEVGSLSVGINAYFEKNISSNRKKAYEEWKGMLSRQVITDTKKLTPVIAMAANGNRFLLNKITEPYLEKNYDKYIFEGNFYTTNYDKQLYQFHDNNHTEITLFVRKDIKIGE